MKFRPLIPGEIIKAGDQYQLSNDDWIPADFKKENAIVKTGVYRRPIPDNAVIVELTPDELHLTRGALHNLRDQAYMHAKANLQKSSVETKAVGCRRVADGKAALQSAKILDALLARLPTNK